MNNFGDINVGYIVNGDVEDKTLWSGTINNLYRAISRKYNVEVLNTNIRLIDILYKIKRKIRKMILKKNSNPMEISYAKLKSKKLDQILRKKECDIIFAPANSNSIAFSKTKIPIIYLSDATFHSMINYYFFGLDAMALRNGNTIEKNALSKADQIIYASEWAKRDAIDFYNVDMERISVIPFGANLEDKSVSRQGLKQEINLLFVGVDWKRKGADIALECLDYLNQYAEQKYKLTIIGLEKPNTFHIKNVEFVEFLNKNLKEDYDRLIDYYMNSDVFLLPTQAECAGIVFSEASMFGLPIVTYDTGGIGTYVKNGVNGYRLPPSATGKDFAAAIEKICNDNETYIRFSENARIEYLERLNWNCWLESFGTVIDKVITSIHQK